MSKVIRIILSFNFLFTSSLLFAYERDSIKQKIEVPRQKLKLVRYVDIHEEIKAPAALGTTGYLKSSAKYSYTEVSFGDAKFKIKKTRSCDPKEQVDKALNIAHAIKRGLKIFILDDNGFINCERFKNSIAYIGDKGETIYMGQIKLGRCDAIKAKHSGKCIDENRKRHWFPGTQSYFQNTTVSSTLDAN